MAQISKVKVKPILIFRTMADAEEIKPSTAAAAAAATVMCLGYELFVGLVRFLLLLFLLVVVFGWFIDVG